jgi:hypothetical protein
MSRKPSITSRGAQKLGERERNVGMEADDEAARWLAENDAKPEPATPKSARRNKALHRWQQRQARG